MKITEQEARLLDKHLTGRRIAGIHCPLCNNDTWSHAQCVAGISEIYPEDRNKMQVTPVITRTCTNCGYLYMHNALIAGVSLPQPKADVPMVANGKKKLKLAKRK